MMVECVHTYGEIHVSSRQESDSSLVPCLVQRALSIRSADGAHWRDLQVNARAKTAQPIH